MAIVVSWPKPRDLADSLDAAALLSLVGFLFAKWAFFNYYFVPATLLLMAFATRGVALGRPEDTRRLSIVEMTFRALGPTFRRWSK